MAAIENGTIQKSYILKRTEILIYIANDEEFKGFKLKLKDLGLTKSIYFEVDNFEINALKYGDYHICYFLGNDTGSRAMNDVLLKVGSEFTNLQYIVNLGCCGTLEKKAGNKVIFANRIFDSDTRKETRKGTKFSIGENRHKFLENAVKSKLAEISCDDYEIEYKPLVAGSAVVKNIFTKKKIIEAYPYAAGVEMEGLAVSSYAIAKGIEWIVIKGTSDNCVSKKGSKGQAEMSYKSTDLFFKILQNEILKLARTKIFVGGSINENESNNDLSKIEDNCVHLGNELLKHKYKIINGLGLGVGTSFVASVYSFKRSQGEEVFGDYIEIFPFPRRVDGQKLNLTPFYTQNRSNMINQSTISLFVYGKINNNVSGTEEEFNEAGSKNLPRISIPITGYVSSILYSNLEKNNNDGISNENYLSKIKSLESEKHFEDSVKLVIEAFEILDDYYFGTDNGNIN